MHRQVPVKVNAVVDEGVAPLVEALNAFESVWTIDSCERDERGAAYVYFSRLEGGKALAGFVDDLSAALGARLDYDDYSLYVEWLAGTETPIAKLSLLPAGIESMAQALHALANERHRNGLLGDTGCRAPRS